MTIETVLENIDKIIILIEQEASQKSIDEQIVLTELIKDEYFKSLNRDSN